MENPDNNNSNAEDQASELNQPSIDVVNSVDAETAIKEDPIIEEGPDFFERLGNKAIWLALGLATCIAFYVYKDFLLFNNVLLYTDIGSDSVNIFYPVWAHYADLWREPGMPSWSMQTAMGQSVGYGGITDPTLMIYVLLGKSNIPFAVAYVEVAKILLTVVFIFKYLSYLNLNKLTCIIGSLLFAFSGYMIMGTAGWPYHSHEALLIAFFLVITEKYIKSKSWIWMAVFSLIMAWTNFILFVQLFIIFIPYVLFRNYENELTLKNNVKSISIAVIGYLLGSLLAFPSLKAAFNFIFKSGRAEGLSASSAVSDLKQTSLFSFSSGEEYDSILLRLFSNDLLGTGNDYKGWFNYLESPILYMGLPCVIFIIAQVTKTTLKQKLTYSILLAICILLIVFPWFRYAYWGFNLNYFRSFGFFINIILFFIAIQGFNNFIINKTNNNYLLYVIAFMFVILFIYPGNVSGNIDNPQRMFVSLFLLIYAGIIYFYKQAKNRNELKWALILLVVVELGMQSHTTVNNRNTLTDEDIQSGKLYGDSTLQVLDWIKKQDTGFYRIAKYYPSGPAQHMSMNDAMVQNFNGLIGYSSLHNKYYMRFLSGTDCIDPKQPDDMKWTYKILSRPFLSAFAGAKYFLDKDSIQLDTLAFKFKAKVNSIYVYESLIAQPIAIAYDQYIPENEFKKLPKWNKDYVLFKAVVISEENLSNVAGLTKFNLKDTISKSDKQAFLLAANERKAMLKQQLKVSSNAITGTIETAKPCIVSFQIPYDANWKLTFNNQAINSFVGNFGFICLKPTLGKNALVLKY